MLCHGVQEQPNSRISLIRFLPFLRKQQRTGRPCKSFSNSRDCAPYSPVIDESATSISDSDLVGAAAAAKGKSTALVFVNSDSGEGYLTVEGHVGDRNDLALWHNGDALIAAVAASNKNTVVVIHSVGAVIMEAWINHPNSKFSTYTSITALTLP